MELFNSTKIGKRYCILLFLLLFSVHAFCQSNEDLKTQPSPFLSKSYFGVNFGAIFYPFSNSNLIDGYSSDTFSNNRFSGRFLLGYKLARDFAIQFGVLRPASWFKYDNVNNIGYKKSVWITAWSLSLKRSFQLNKRFSLYAEAGVANLTRVGFDINDKIIYPSAHFANLIYGVGANYHISKKWKLSFNGTFLPKSQKYNQPSISQASIGFEYHLQKKPEELAKEYSENSYFFPENIIQVSYGTHETGFGVNRFFGMSMKVGNFESFGIPVFWVGDVKARNAFSITYQRLAYRSRKDFSLEWGVSITSFNTISSREPIFAFSIFPVIRFYLLRRPEFDFYTNYSIVGPTFLTKKNIDNLDSGPKATFQDTLGFGVFLGKERKYNLELRIMHYSNGNIFPQNSGVAIPLQLTIGKTF